MTPSAAAAADARRLVLVPVEPRADELVRRYRLARVRLETQHPKDRAERFAHLKRSYD